MLILEVVHSGRRQVEIDERRRVQDEDLNDGESRESPAKRRFGFLWNRTNSASEAECKDPDNLYGRTQQILPLILLSIERSREAAIN